MDRIGLVTTRFRYDYRARGGWVSRELVGASMGGEDMMYHWQLMGYGGRVLPACLQAGVLQSRDMEIARSPSDEEL